MAAALKFILSAINLFLFISNGAGLACHLSDIIIQQAKSGRIVEGKPEYLVTVSNKCECPQSKVVLQCYGLSSVEPVNPQAIRAVDDESCMVAGGRPIARGSPVKFKYAWLTPQDFPVVSSHVNC
ncbi:hypothetical protein J5N97_007147 [Dioscorea zingiberensis]|uniref:Uncharacterized protein n=1 Tax=Dioscorea zingiberensis TaxID=325984 RepID=A0A9D5DB96_9LILI|nr:hypothetical protein J5N97_007147 [Dioscorea zingiberensis]